MSTRAQRRANQRNAQLSTGPKTDQGKQRSSQNALKHGLRSKHPVIPGEDPVEYQHQLDQLRDDIRPANAIEDSLVEQIADTSWRLRRISRIEAAIERRRIESAAGDEKNRGKDDEQIRGAAFAGWSDLDYLSRLSRYESQLSRRYHRAIKELTGLRKTYQETYIRTRPMEERDQEEKEWRERHHQQPPGQLEPPPRQQTATRSCEKIGTVTSAGEGPADEQEPSGSAADCPSQLDSAHNSERNEQSQSVATDLDSMTSEELDQLHPDEALKLIEKNLEALLPTTGHLGPQEVKK